MSVLALIVALLAAGSFVTTIAFARSSSLRARNWQGICERMETDDRSDRLGRADEALVLDVVRAVHGDRSAADAPLTVGDARTLSKFRSRRAG